MKTEMRRIDPTDLDEVINVIHQTTLESYRADYPKAAIDYFIRYHAPQNIESDIRNGFMAGIIKDGLIIGTGALIGLNIRRVFVLPTFQGQGYGNLIMNCLEDAAKENKLDFIELHSSQPAKKFYDNRHYKTLKFCSIPVENNLTLDYLHMAKMIKKVSAKPLFNLHNKKFCVIENSGPGAEVNQDTVFTFSQTDELVMGAYNGGMVKEGTIIGFIEGDRFHFHYEQVNRDGQKNSGNANDVLECEDDGTIRIIDSWKWETKEGSGQCVMQEER
jgi:GNAT superfamily N-acetyltransferase